MTISEKMILLLTEHGLLPGEADKALAVAKANDIFDSMERRWNDPVNGYPLQMVVVLWISIKRITAEWLAEHQPKHWARPMFEDGKEQSNDRT